MAMVPIQRTATPPDLLDYPGSGKNAMPSLAHERAMLIITQILIRLFSPVHLVATNLSILLDPTDWRRHVTPDLMLAFGAGELDPVYGVLRRQYRLWDEAGPPDLVMEAASTSTIARDNAGKKEDYAAMGVREYVQFDPIGDLLQERLVVYRLLSGRYEPIPAEADGSIPSSALEGYAWVREDDYPRLRDRATSILVPTPAEEAAAAGEAARAAREAARTAQEAARAAQGAARAAQEAARTAEAARAEEAARTQAAEAEVARLRAELERLRGS